MAVSFLKKHSEIVNGATSLKYRLHKSMAKYEAARSIKTIHASDMTKPDFCPRRFALLDITGKKATGQFISTSLRATFDLGRALQDSLNMEWGVEWCMGTWKCRVCKARYKFQHKPSECVCGHNLFRYDEEKFVSKYAGYSGSIDYIFKTPQCWWADYSY